MLKKIIIILGKAFLNLIYFSIKLIPSKRQIVYISMQSDDISLDFKLLKEDIEKRDKNIRQVFLCKKMKSGLNKKSDYVIYVLKMIGYVFKAMFYLATSKVCITESYCVPISILKHKKELKIIQIWHASGAVKKFGYQILDKQEGKSKEVAQLMCMHKNYNYIIAPSDATKEFFCQAFNMSKDNVVKLGLPRLEYITNDKFDKSEEIYKEYPELKEKKVILYVPTFRKEKQIDLTEILNYDLDTNKYRMIIKLHPLENTAVPEKFKIDKKYLSYDLLKIADYIITDYSAILIEASCLEKPMFVYLYDIKQYSEDRGLNINLKKELSTFTSNSFSDIMSKIEKNDYNVREITNFKNKYIEIDPTNTISELSKFIFKLLKQE